MVVTKAKLGVDFSECGEKKLAIKMSFIPSGEDWQAWSSLLPNLTVHKWWVFWMTPLVYIYSGTICCFLLVFFPLFHQQKDSSWNIREVSYPHVTMLFAFHLYRSASTEFKNLNTFLLHVLMLKVAGRNMCTFCQALPMGAATTSSACSFCPCPG